MSIFRSPYERHDHRGGLDSGLVYYLLSKYSVPNQKWLEQFHGGETPQKVATQLGLRWETVSIEKGQDARRLEWIDSEFDGVLSHPPYWTAIKYSDDPRDLSNCETYETFVGELGKTLLEAERVLQPGGHLIVVTGDLRRDKVMYPLHSDVIQFMKQFKNLVLKDMVIWELSATGTAMLGTEWMLMGNYCIVWGKVGYDVGRLFK